MKNKKMVYLLLALSAVVWGGVFVRLYGVFVKDKSSADKLFKKSTPAIYQSGKDTFELLVNYKDPFFKRTTTTYGQSAPSAAARSALAAVRNKKQQVKEIQVMDWSFVQFKGTIKRKSTGRVVSLLVIHNKDYSLEDGSQAENIHVVKNCKDSVLIKYNGINKYIKR